MSNIFCSQCGAKHLVGAKFCSSCGNPLSVLAQPQRKTNLSRLRNEIEEEEAPDSFVRPTKLAYEIDRGPTNKYRAEDVFKSNPISESERVRPNISNVKRMSKEELLRESLKECAPRGVQDIDET